MTQPDDVASGGAAPSQPGWYADAVGAWWWWDGAAWTPAPARSPDPDPEQAQRQARATERTTALVMWIAFLVVGGWVAALIFYLLSKEKAFVRHHSAEALNLTLVLLVPQILAAALLVPGYVSFIGDTLDAEPGTSVSYDFDATFWLGVALMVISSVANLAVAIGGAVMAHRGRWWRAPLPFHPVRGVVAKGEEPYSVGDA